MAQPQSNVDIELGTTNNPIVHPTNNDKKEEEKDEAVAVSFRRGKNKDATLAEKLRQLEAGEIDDKKIHERVNKFNRIMAEQEALEDKKKNIIAFKYATDMSYLRNSTPDQMWVAILRREAWAQGTWKMAAISAAQVVICLVVLLTANSPINNSTVFMAVIYLMASSSTNPFEVTKDLISLVQQNYEKNFRPSLALRIIYWIVLILLSPLAIIPLGVTFTLDMVVGKINNISYGEMVNIIVNFIVVFTGFSVGLRSGNAVNAVQTFAGFSFIGDMDEAIMQTFDVDTNALTSHKHGAGKNCKILTVRITLYVLVPILLGFFIYVTIENSCFAFCNDAR